MNRKQSIRKINKKSFRKTNYKNNISKKKKKFGGSNIYTWNLGPIILKKEKGLISDTYWLEYPIDPIENGWTQIKPTNEDFAPRYKCSETIKPPKEGYTWNNVSEIENYHRPLVDGSFVSVNCDIEKSKCDFNEHNHNIKLSELIWQKSDIIPNTRIKGKKQFIRNFHDSRPEKNTMELFNVYYVKKTMKTLYDILKYCVLNNTNRPIEFNDLYNDIKGDYWKYDVIAQFMVKSDEFKKKVAAEAKAKADAKAAQAVSDD